MIEFISYLSYLEISRNELRLTCLAGRQFEKEVKSNLMRSF
jgi:hypothetical protein